MFLDCTQCTENFQRNLNRSLVHIVCRKHSQSLKNMFQGYTVCIRSSQDCLSMCLGYIVSTGLLLVQNNFQVDRLHCRMSVLHWVVQFLHHIAYSQSSLGWLNMTQDHIEYTELHLALNRFQPSRLHYMMSGH